MEVTKETENYTTDAPISKKDNDKFQRFNFSKRIAETIVQRKSSDSIVIGIYGDWGEGKTSVLNFIEHELIDKQDIVVCKFNPWRFHDETQLLIGFFKLLSTQLQKSILTKSEKAGKLITDYSELFIPNFSFAGGIVDVDAGGMVKKIGEKMSTVDIFEQKKRIEDFLKDEKKRIVIFIDDIDRLDKKEIQALFKLVKLTADFSFTSYVLAFDEKMVAKAIGEIYEDGGEKAGKNFLEKIIQVPLRLPLAQKEALKKFCFLQVDNALYSNGIDLPKDDASRFVKLFTLSTLSRLTTPRMAVRYGNAISFSMPILHKEVNIVDLMIIEAVKVFYPEMYDFIRSNSHFFVNNYNSIYASRDGRNEERKKKCKEEITRISNLYSSEAESDIKELLIQLFPILKEVFHNYSHSENSFKQWHLEKRIGSPQYFQRYFSYTVIEGDVSDIEFEKYLEEISVNNLSTNVKLTTEFLDNVNPDKFFYKFQFKMDNFPFELRKKLALAISLLGDKFPSNDSVFSIDNSFGKGAYLVFQLIESMSDKTERFDLAKEVMSKSEPIDFAIEIMRSFRNDRDNENIETRTLLNEEFDEISLIILKRAQKASSEVSIFEMYTENASFLLSRTWKRLLGSESVMNYIKSILDKNPEKLPLLLESYCPLIHSSNHNEPYYGDLERNLFDWIKDSFDIDYLHKIAVQLLDYKIESIKYIKMENKQTHQNLLQQFVFHYNQTKRELTAEIQLGEEFD